MADNTISVPLSDVMKNVTVKIEVTGLRRLQWRMWLGGKFFIMGALITGCNVEVVDNSDG